MSRYVLTASRDRGWPENTNTPREVFLTIANGSALDMKMKPDEAWLPWTGTLRRRRLAAINDVEQPDDRPPSDAERRTTVA